MAETPYKAKTLSGAEREVRMLRKQRAQLTKLLEQYAVERRLLAMVAAKGPCFFNPIDAMEAEMLRDRILRYECRLTPDGKRLEA